MIFDKQAFSRNAEPNIKKLIPSSHIDLLDGMTVIFKNSKFGEVPHYEVEGEEFYLYPVFWEWCIDGEEMNQMSLFDESEGT